MTLIRCILIFYYGLNFFFTFAARTSTFGLPEVQSYAKVSRIVNNRIENITGQSVNNVEARGFRNNNGISYRSPVYLHKGETLDHSSTMKDQHYSTLDREAVAKLDILNSGQMAQKRFHPPAKFEHTIAHSNAAAVEESSSSSQAISPSISGKPVFPVPSYATLPLDVYSTNYRQPDTKPFNVDHSTKPDEDVFTEIRDSYQNIGDAPKFSFPSSSSSSFSSYGEKYPPKPLDYDDASFVDDSYLHHDHHNYPHELIYDHPPTTTTTTTEEPEMNDQRLSKRPYSYYYIGKKLWYLPLYFSIYFIIYIAALVLKSITRHKINFPASLAAVSADARHVGNIPNNWEHPSWFGLTKKVLDGIDAYNSIGKTTK